MVYCRFFQFWLIFPDRNYKSRSIEYNFNWYWRHALHLKKKTIPIFENLVTTSRTTTKVVSCLKILLTSMCVVVRTSSPGSRLRQFFPTSLPHELVFKSIEETLLQPVLKSFITVFIHCKITNKSSTIRLDYIYILLFLESNISTLMIYKQTNGCTFFH